MDKNKNVPNDVNNTEENEQNSGQTDKIRGDSSNPQMDTVDEQNLDSKKSEVPKVKLEKKSAQKRASIGKGSILVEPVKRRTFFSWLTLAWLAFTAATGTFFGIMLRFMFPNVLFEPKQTFKAGYPDDYNMALYSLVSVIPRDYIICVTINILCMGVAGRDILI